MILKRFYLKCLSHGSYLLADDESREAALVDPQRDVGGYLEILRQEGLRLKYILETHVHADFVSGHWELAGRTGAEVVFGEKAQSPRPHRKVRDGETLMLGRSVAIEVLETPGHTPESVCYLVRDREDRDAPPTLFSGDTLFVGDVGRPDLLGSRMPAADLASRLYDSLERKLKTLPDDTRVYPAHGAGSACGKQIGDAEFTTIGEEKARNEAMKAPDRETFIRMVTSDLPDAPEYFSEDARLNLEGVGHLDDVLGKLVPLSPAVVMAAQERGTVILDTRSPADFAWMTLQGALNIGLDGQFAPWLGTLLKREDPIILIAEPGREEEAAIRCGRIGFENLRGYLEGGIARWFSLGFPVARYERISPLAAAGASRAGEILLDVRNPAETRDGTAPGAIRIPLGRLSGRLQELDRNTRIVAYCAGGYRSAMAVGLLRRAGFVGVRDMDGGFQAWRAAGLPVAKEATLA